MVIPARTACEIVDLKAQLGEGEGLLPASRIRIGELVAKLNYDFGDRSERSSSDQNRKQPPVESRERAVKAQ